MTIYIYTSRIDYPGGLDITVKSAGALGRILAPSWDLVMGHKRSILSDADYTTAYLTILRQRYREHHEAFIDVLKLGTIVLCCYCAVGKFCHRHIASDVLAKIAISMGYPTEIRGEIDKHYKFQA